MEQGLGILQKKGRKPLSKVETGTKIGKMLKASDKALAMGFRHAACGPLVRSSYHADQQAHEAGVGEFSK